MMAIRISVLIQPSFPSTPYCTSNFVPMPSLFYIHLLAYAGSECIYLDTFISYVFPLFCTGPPVCDVILMFVSTSTTVTAMWTVTSCEGAFPTIFEFQWTSTVSDCDKGTSGLISGVTQLVIEGLSNGTVYNISVTLSDDCGTGSTLNRNVSTLYKG